MVEVRASDPRLRLFRHLLGARQHTLPDMVYRIEERGQWSEPAPVVPERERSVRTGEVRNTRRRVDPSPNAPQLIRLVQTPYVQETARPVRDPSKGLPARVKLGDVVREPFSSAKDAALAANKRKPFPNATAVHPPHVVRPRPSADAWLKEQLVSNPAIRGAQLGPMSGRNVIGEVTEALHRFLLDGYDIGEQPPRLEEDLSFVPKDREEVLYIYMYRVAQNPALKNQKRYRAAPVFVGTDPEDGGEVYYHRPPLLMDLFYLVGVHSKFRSDAERLLGWMLLRLNEATHLLYRPRKFSLPDGRLVDSLGRPWSADIDLDEDKLQVEKVSLALVDDLTVGDAINFFSLHEAPYRPFVTYRARVALDGPLIRSEGGTTIRMPPLSAKLPDRGGETLESPTGRIKTPRARPGTRPTTAPGPQPHFHRRLSDDESETED